MRKTLIKIVSVITLVFGTCYQSVLALADDRDRTELSGVQLSDSKGNKLHQVKVNETNELEMTVTVNNKDGENKDGKAAMWLPEDQLKVLQEQVKAESAVTDTNATLIFERRKNNQSLVEWKNVETSATFNLKLPVQFTSTMTSMALPIALGTQHGYLQPLSVVSEDATEEEMKEAGTPTDLPADILGSLTSFINSQQAQQAQQAQEEQQKQQAQQNAEQEAPAKDENGDKNTVKEEAAKEEAEAKRDAEKKAEQEAADKDKEAAKTRDALKKNSKTADAESKTDGAKRESQDKKETKAEGRDLNEILAGNTGANKSLFESIEINQNGQITPVKPNETLDVSDLKDKDFELVYKWDSTSLQEKIKGDIRNGDHYTLRIEGLKYNGDKTSGELLDNGGQEFAKCEVVKSEGNYQEIKIIFTNEKANLTQVDYTLRLSQTYTGENPIEFEQSADAIWTGKPAEVKSLLGKSGQFVNDDEIQWEITLKKDGDIKFSDLKLEDVINMKGAQHTFLPETLDIFYTDDENLKLLGMFNEPDFSVNNKMALTGKTPEESADPKDDLVQSDITIRIRTKIKDQKGGTFYNQIGGQVSDDIRLNNVEASVTTAQLDKTRTKYENGIYTWKADVTLNLDQFKDSEGNIDEDKAIQAIQNMKITDELSGPHRFQDDHKLEIMVGGSNVTMSFDVSPKTFPNNELVLTPKENEAKTILEALKDNNTGKLTLTYNRKLQEQVSHSVARHREANCYL